MYIYIIRRIFIYVVYVKIVESVNVVNVVEDDVIIVLFFFVNLRLWYL